MIKQIASLLMIALFVQPVMAQETGQNANAQPFGEWLAGFKKRAVSVGIRSEVLDRAMSGVSPNPRVVELDRKQPESGKTYTEYLDTILSEERIATGRQMLQQHKPLLEQVAKTYGVQPRFIVALWGVETHYGKITGGFPVVESLATLAYDGRRGEFFTKELLNALAIIQQGHIAASRMQGSWAGAMGQSQFMPSSFLNFAVDYNQDGRKDIWHSLPDIFASIANYLYRSGWNGNIGWGERVRIPGSFDMALADGTHFKSAQAWRALGVRNATGDTLANQFPEGTQLALTVPGRRSEPAFLVTSNFDVLLKWNRSRYFASAVGLLADEISR